MITIDEIMTPDPYTLGTDHTLEDARKLMTEKHIRHIPITDQESRLVGLVTQRDILEASVPLEDASSLSPAERNPSLANIMIRNVHSIHERDSVRQGAIYLQQHKYGCLPVVADDKLIGIITDSDYIGIAINLMEQVEISEDDGDIDIDDIDDLDLPGAEEDF